MVEAKRLIHQFAPLLNQGAFTSITLAALNPGSIDSIPDSWLQSGAWSIVGSKLVMNNPTLGSDLVVNGDFATDTVWSKGTGWTISDGAANHTATGAGSLTQPILNTGKWYQVTLDITVNASTLSIYLGAGAIFSIGATGTYTITGRSTGGGALLQLAATAAFVGSINNIVCKNLPINDLLLAKDISATDVKIKPSGTRFDRGFQYGSIGWLDDDTTPANFVIAYLDGQGNFKADKCVAGTYTNLISVATTYVDGQWPQLEGYRSGANLLITAKYNGSTIGTEQIISDAGIIDNTLHGLFSTHENPCAYIKIESNTP